MINKYEKQILENQKEIMMFLLCFRTLVANIEINGGEVDPYDDDNINVFRKSSDATDKLLKE